MPNDFVVENIIERVSFLCSIIKSILYFCAGTVVAIKLLAAPSIIENMETGGIRFYILCIFIMWCWIFSKLIIL